MMKSLIIECILLLYFIQCALSLECIQCDMSDSWYSEDEHERHVTACQQGVILPTPCTNKTHTHCIITWFRSGGNTEKTITERKCGVAEDVTGCTLYNSQLTRRVRHLLNRESPRSELRKETATLFVEVCSDACNYGDCINSSTNWAITNVINYQIVAFISIFLLSNAIFE